MRIAFQLLGTPFTEVNIVTEAAWTAALTATDAKKIVLTPFLSDAGDPITSAEPNQTGGNDGTTPDGTPIVESYGFSSGLFQIMGPSSAQIEALRSLTGASISLSSPTRLGMYLFCEGDKIGSIGGKPIPVKNVVIPDPTLGGRGKAVNYPLRFNLPALWSKGLTFHKAPFSLNALINA
ncbi:hypothetical protein BWI97_15755 [Siphonobacter sp. BAB-5405]|nr:hypothetical protein BWI97_15755 [Siphonobacter sp. BAB-5405]